MKKHYFFILFLIVLASSVRAQFVGGHGVEESPFLISTPDQLDFLREMSNNGYFYYRLINDIEEDDMLMYIQNRYGAQGWEPIGNAEVPFYGNFDGGGHVINGLWMRRSGQYMGLFGFVARGSIIKNTGVGICEERNMFVDVSPGWEIYVGGLIGYNEAEEVSECFVKGGSIVVRNPPVIGGGLIGLNAEGCLVINCYSRVNIVEEYPLPGYRTLGSFMGINYGIIFLCYTSGVCQNGAGPFICLNYSGNCELVYCLENSIGQPACVDYTGLAYNLRILNIFQMKQQANYWEFDFDNIWKIKEGHTLPYFVWEHRLLKKIHSFSYDESGNRILRQVIYLENIKPFSITSASGTKGGSKISKEVNAETKKNQQSEEIQPVVSKLSSFELLVYPNPTQGQLKVEIQGNEEIKNVEMQLYTKNGQKIYGTRNVQSSYELDLSSHSDGVYILRMVLNGKPHEWKIIKK